MLHLFIRFIIPLGWLYILMPLALSTRVLCLHGKGNTGETFLKTIQPLVQRLEGHSIEWLIPDATFPIEDHTAFQWWGLPPGLRSFETKEYIGMELTLQRVESLYPVDVVFGFSQGAILTSVLLMRGIQGKSFLPRKAILAGAAWPNPYNDDMLSLSSDAVSQLNLRTLHVIGERDRTNPPEMALRLQQLFRGELLRHPGGHIVPVDQESYIKAYADLILN